MERAISWRLWGQKYFPDSMKFHYKEWVKKFDATHEKCRYCSQKVRNFL